MLKGEEFDPDSKELAGLSGREAKRLLMSMPRDEAKRILKATIRRILAKRAGKPQPPAKPDPFAELVTECVREVLDKRDAQ